MRIPGAKGVSSVGAGTGGTGPSQLRRNAQPGERAEFRYWPGLRPHPCPVLPLAPSSWPFLLVCPFGVPVARRWVTIARLRPFALSILVPETSQLHWLADSKPGFAPEGSKNRLWIRIWTGFPLCCGNILKPGREIRHAAAHTLCVTIIAVVQFFQTHGRVAPALTPYSLTLIANQAQPWENRRADDSCTRSSGS
ncbi:hypothetical protein SAMN04488568_102188 [Maricaulis salignorans]|uniref:Uncharacterized protein n=1 Tax=Maricaulis salignorans TaxID=144026 RepID=A0A1G9N1R2_9PROT|nr:hypothetical protein SAMN04488568_102188 [Maricaulis salignorans]